MNTPQTTDVITIMERTLNYIDPRLQMHGRRVSYIVYQLLSLTGRYSELELRNICIAALLHDIGAYQTEEIDRMISFETRDTWDHSIYGYLFFKHFSPFPDLGYPILHHHTLCTALEQSDPRNHLAQVFFLADRIDVYTHAGITGKDKLMDLLDKQTGKLFYPEIVALAKDPRLRIPVLDQDVAGDSEINRALRSIPLTREENADFLKMIVLFIDFRSHQTLTHTITTASISASLADLLGLEADARDSLVAGSWLHDIGKTGVPLAILEKPDKLTSEEMSVIMQHVDLTDEILAGCVSEETRKIAAHHHEKMNGSGYPEGLDNTALTMPDRIVVVADIFSALCGVRSYKDAFPKERVVQILTQMKEEGLLDPLVVDASIANYESIMARTAQDARPLERSFQEINVEFFKLKRERSRYLGK